MSDGKSVYGFPLNCPLEKFCRNKKLQYQKTGKGKIGALCPVSVEKRRDLACQARKVRKQEKPSKKEHSRQEQVGYDSIGWY